jgi:DNA repair protein RecO
MIVNAWGVVLARRDHGEADRLCTIYTENLGKILVRFVGVNKPGRKLKALSEPLTWGEYRLYVSPKTDMGKAIGGQIIGCFPGIREDLGRTVDALSCCELLSALTSERDANSEKYELLTGALNALEHGAGGWVTLAYGLRLLDLAGFGLPERAAAGDQDLFSALRERPWHELPELPWDAAAASRLSQTLYDHAEAQAGRPLKTRGYAEALSAQEVLQ